MTDPNIFSAPQNYQIDLTVLLSVTAVCLTAMGTLVAIFRKKSTELKDDEFPGKTPMCLQKKTDIERIEREAKELSNKLDKFKDESRKKIEEIRQMGNDANTEIGILKNESLNSIKGIDNTKAELKDIASKLDDLLKQLLDWMTD